jgi:hypothetical protein
MHVMTAPDCDPAGLNILIDLVCTRKGDSMVRRRRLKIILEVRMVFFHVVIVVQTFLWAHKMRQIHEKVREGHQVDKQ